jgi:hypothetical protein
MRRIGSAAHQIGGKSVMTAQSAAGARPRVRSYWGSRSGPTIVAWRRDNWEQFAPEPDHERPGGRARPCTYKSAAVTQRRLRPLRPVSDQARAAAQHVAKGHKPKRNRAEVKENQSECVEWTCRMTTYERTDGAL